MQESMLSTLSKREIGKTQREGSYQTGEPSSRISSEFTQFLVENDAVRIFGDGERNVMGRGTYMDVDLGKIGSAQPWRGATAGFLRTYLIQEGLAPTKVYGTDIVTKGLAKDVEILMKPRVEEAGVDRQGPLVIDGVTYNGGAILNTIARDIDQGIIEDAGGRITAIGIVDSLRSIPTKGKDPESVVRRFEGTLKTVTGISDYPTEGSVQSILRQADIEFRSLTDFQKILAHYEREFDVPDKVKEGMSRQFSEIGQNGHRF